MNQKGLSTQVAVLLGAAIISFSILLGNGVIKIKGLSTGKTDTAVAAPAAAPAAAAPTAAAPDPSTPVKVELADAPVLGKKDAPVTIVEFSDYECPFCKRHFDETHGQLVKNYIDTGKAKLVFRNLPLSFHANAHKEAQAAECAKDQGGDSAYYKFHDIMFTKTTSNGTGLSIEQLPDLAKQVGLDGDKMKSCIDSGKFKDLVDKDLAYASTIGASGTPTFFIGKSDNSGTITANILVGAQPYTAFQSKIDSLLQ